MYVLIIVFLSGYGPRPHVVTQEFTSEKNCITAAAAVRKGWGRSNDARILNHMECVPK
jgi:hypothetical protein